MEEYIAFIDIDELDYIHADYYEKDVFAYNDKATNFYNKNGYHSRMHTNIKK